MYCSAAASTTSASSDKGSAVFVHQAFIEIAGLKVGKFLSWWDDGLSGETDDVATNALFNSVRYTMKRVLSGLVSRLTNSKVSRSARSTRTTTQVTMSASLLALARISIASLFSSSVVMTLTAKTALFA